MSALAVILFFNTKILINNLLLNLKFIKFKTVCPKCWIIKFLKFIFFVLFINSYQKLLIFNFILDIFFDSTYATFLCHTLLVKDLSPDLQEEMPKKIKFNK